MACQLLTYVQPVQENNWIWGSYRHAELLLKVALDEELLQQGVGVLDENLRGARGPGQVRGAQRGAHHHQPGPGVRFVDLRAAFKCMTHNRHTPQFQTAGPNHATSYIQLWGGRSVCVCVNKARLGVFKRCKHRRRIDMSQIRNMHA